jgi:hypothetical protein
MAEVSNPARASLDARGPPTSPSGKRFTESDFVSDFLNTLRTSSRPGRLVAATACPGRHETPGTHLGRAESAAFDLR